MLQKIKAVSKKGVFMSVKLPQGELTDRKQHNSVVTENIKVIIHILTV